MWGWEGGVRRVGRFHAWTETIPAVEHLQGQPDPEYICLRFTAKMLVDKVGIMAGQGVVIE